MRLATRLTRTVRLMNWKQRCLGMLITTLLFSSNTWADKVVGLVTFQSGTPAKSSEVNGNFTAVKSAVDSNDDRLIAVEAGKQKRVTGACPDNSAVKSVDANGNVVCEAFQKEGFVTLGPGAFSPIYENDSLYCSYQGWHMGRPRGTLTSQCVVVAQVTLPQSVLITDLQCSVRDFVTGDARVDPIELWRTSMLTGTSSNITSTNASVDSPDVQVLIAGGTAGGDAARVDNGEYVYEIGIIMNANGATFNSLGGNLGVYACKVLYTP